MNISIVPTLKRVAAVAVLALVGTGLAADGQTDLRIARLETEIRYRLLALPYYGVFDLLGFRVDPGGVVTLTGQVTRVPLKAEAERALRDVSGIERIVNEIEILPVSINDDRIRLATYRAIYRHDALEPYAFRAMPPIRIIVKNGHVTLEGVVGSEVDKRIAEAQARSVPGAFSVTSRLEVEGRRVR